MVLTISLTLVSTALVGYRKFSERRILSDSLGEIRDQLRLARSRAIHGEKPDSAGIPPDTCNQLLSYRVEIEVVAGGTDKIVSVPVCSRGDGPRKEHEIAGVSLSPVSGWPITILALEGTVSQAAVLNVSYGSNPPGSVTVGISGNIE